MSTIRKLQRSVSKKQHTAKDDDSGGSKQNMPNKHRQHDNKSSASYLKTMNADSFSKQNKAIKRQKIG